MEISSPEISKLLKMFCVIGLDETKITKYRDEDSHIRFIKDLDIIRKKMKINVERVENVNEKW